jgi:hypothetical protein
MEFVAHQSFFVVFPNHGNSTAVNQRSENFPGTKPLITLKGSWEVSFDPEWGGPTKVIFDELQDWSTHADAGIRYYSGMAAYHKTFEMVESSEPHSKFFLDLGTVHEIAKVRLNGRDLGVVWCAPWQVDITEVVKAGINELEIEVANLWPNRLTGDATKPQEERLTWTITGHPYNAESKLLPSGLSGPVTIQMKQF